MAGGAPNASASVAIMAAPVGVVNSAWISHSAKGIPRNNSAVAGAGTRHRPWAISITPPPVGTGGLGPGEGLVSLGGVVEGALQPDAAVHRRDDAESIDGHACSSGAASGAGLRGPAYPLRGPAARSRRAPILSQIGRSLCAAGGIGASKAKA